tara:strand:+ start:919 stop:1380 length:462 start_codon:yes stop_codon:yes gene_type:complete
MVSSKDKLLMTNINIFYKKNPIDNVLDIIKGKSKISLRLLDWFVTNYAKSNPVIINNINIYLNYKSQLKAFSKKQFDPFCRRERIVYYYSKDESILTTVGQLNFFKWLFEYNILDYINNNLEPIENSMNKNKMIIRSKKQISKNNVKVVVQFK